MADPFEARLAAMFDAPVDEGDAGAFLRAVEAKLEKKRAARRAVGLLAAAGAALTAAVGVGATGLSAGFAELVVSAGARIGSLFPALPSAALQAEVGWSVIGLILLGLALGANRLIEEVWAGA
jgi:hypothetical protein